MENQHTNHIVKYKTHVFVLGVLLLLTFSSVGITKLEFGVYSIAAALVFACIKSTLVLMYFMHLKSESKFYTYMVLAVVILLVSIIFVTFLDYSYR